MELPGRAKGHLKLSLEWSILVSTLTSAKEKETEATVMFLS